MARARLVAKSLSTSTRFAQLHAAAGPLGDFAQLLFPLLVAHADDWGRLAGDPFTVKHSVVPTSPHSEEDVRAALEALTEVHLIQWYVVEGRPWIQIDRFDQHQSGLHKRRPSTIPPVLPGSSGKFPVLSGNSGSCARAESESESESEVRTERTRLRRQPHPVQKSKPEVAVLAAMIRDEVLPLKLTDEGDLIEAAKSRAATLRLAYTGSAIRRALASARSQRRRSS